MRRFNKGHMRLQFWFGGLNGGVDIVDRGEAVQSAPSGDDNAVIGVVTLMLMALGVSFINYHFALFSCLLVAIRLFR